MDHQSIINEEDEDGVASEDWIEDFQRDRRISANLRQYEDELFRDEEEEGEALFDHQPPPVENSLSSSSLTPPDSPEQHQQTYQQRPSYNEAHEFSESHDVALMLLPSISAGDDTTGCGHGHDGTARDGSMDDEDMPQRIMTAHERQQSARQQSMRRDHLRNLLRRKNMMRRYLKSTLISKNNAYSNGTNNNQLELSEQGDVPMPLPAPMLRAKPSGWSALSSWTSTALDTSGIFASPEELRVEKERHQKMRDQRESFVKKYHMDTIEFPIEVRINSLTYKVPVPPGSSKIPTVYNSSQIYFAYKFLQRLWMKTPKPLPGEKTVLNDISLVLKPGKMYLLLAPPGAGKTSLLKAISGRLRPAKGAVVEGSVCYNGKTLQVCLFV